MTLKPPNGATLAQSPRAEVIFEAPINVQYPEYGALADNSTNDTAAVQAAITAASSVEGGVVYFPAGRYILDGQLTIPVTGAGAYPKQKALRLMGDEGFAAGQAATAPSGGSVLNVRSATGPGKIYTRGLGLLEIDHLTLRDTSGSANPFIYTTGTTLRVHDCGFYGDANKARTLCDQDAIVLGGTSITEDGSSSQPFQGYVTSVSNCWFDAIRRSVYARTYANGTIIEKLWMAHSCGSNLANGAAIEVLGVASNSTTGVVVNNNAIEMLGYVYGVKMNYATGCILVGNAFYDPGAGVSTDATSVAGVRFESSAAYNTVLTSFNGTPIAEVSEHASVAGTNSVFTAGQGQPTRVQKLQVGDSSTTLTNNGTGRLRLPKIETQRLGVYADQFAASAGGAPVLSQRMRVYDESGNFMGWVPVYSSI